jgi:rhamnose transport system permease protein
MNIKRLLFSRENLLALAIVFIIALVSLRAENFWKPYNLNEIFSDTSILIILALGQMVVILTKCIDLSVAANLALSGMCVALINTAFPDFPVPLLITIAIGLGTLMGIFNGILVWKLDIPPIVVTLGTLAIFRGIIFLLTNGEWVNAHEMSKAFVAFPRTEFLTIPVFSWIAILMIIGFVILVNRTTLGRAFFAVGGNPQAAIYTGINVGKTQFFAFAISGAVAGLCGYLWIARYTAAYVDIAKGFELNVVAACVIGGIAIAGGAGSVLGATLGALFIGVINKSLPVIDVSPFWQLAISGSAIIIAVAFNAWTDKKKSKIILKIAEQQA